MITQIQKKRQLMQISRSSLSGLAGVSESRLRDAESELMFEMNLSEYRALARVLKVRPTTLYVQSPDGKYYPRQRKSESPVCFC